MAGSHTRNRPLPVALPCFNLLATLATCVFGGNPAFLFYSSYSAKLAF